MWFKIINKFSTKSPHFWQKCMLKVALYSKCNLVCWHLNLKFNMLKVSLISPFNLRFWWNFGRLLLIVFSFQILRGFFLTFYYRRENSFIFLLQIYWEVLNIKIIQQIHIRFATLIFLVLYLHIFKAFYFGSFFNQPIAWVRGYFSMVLTIAISFLGYVLPWGQISLWGATVITSLIRVLPFGKILVEWVWGGFFVSAYTLKLFFSFHFILPFILIIIIVTHMIFLHYKGSSNPLMAYTERIKKEFAPVYILKDLINLKILVIFMVFTLLKFIRVEEEDNFQEANIMSSPLHIKPEWYFLQYYAILRAIPNKTGGLILFLSSFCVLLLLGGAVSNLANPAGIQFWKFLVIIFSRLNILLGWLGAQPVTFFFLNLSQTLTLAYFLWFFILIFYLFFLL